jgi:hypothetical protein
MYLHDPRLASNPGLCREARQYALIADEAIAKITPQTSPAQIQAVLQALQSLYETLEAGKSMFHQADSPGHGIHPCLREVFRNACCKLEIIGRIQPEPKPEPPPKQQLITLSGVVIDLEEEYYTSREETDLGAEDTPPDTWRDR